MRGSEFVFDNVDLLHYNLNIISLKRGGWYMYSPKWLKNKKATINPKNNDRCFQYDLSAALSHKQIKSHPERIWKIKPFIDQYNWKRTEFPSYQKDWNKFELYNKSIPLIISLLPYNTEEIRLAHKSKYNSSIIVKIK